MGKREILFLGLQRGLLPFGVAIQKEEKGRYTYHISPAKFYEYLYGTNKPE